MSGYMLIVSDSITSDILMCPRGAIPIVYSKLADAMNALKAMADTMNTLKILYGTAFPYEDTTFEEELEKNGHAFYGYGDYVMDDDECRVPFGLRKVNLL